MKKSTVRTISLIQIKELPGEIQIYYTGNGFLQNMARILTGTLIEIGDTIETEEVAFVPMTKEIDDETAYNAFGTITSKSGNNYVIVVKSEKELTQDNLETVAEAVKEQVK